MNNVTLYHGSKGGIINAIQPSSRIRCDFGQGFYMNDKPEPAKITAYSDMCPILYTVDLKLSQIPNDKILVLKDMDWAYFVLYNQGKLENIKNTNIYEKIQRIGENKDVIIGPIVDNNLNSILKLFHNNKITDKVLLECIKSFSYDIQYVAKTQDACDLIDIRLQEDLDLYDCEKYYNYKIDRLHENINKFHNIKNNQNNDGKYLNQIITEQIKP